jgi:hypothetical protein
MKLKNNYWTILQYEKRYYSALGWESELMFMKINNTIKCIEKETVMDIG